jgi:hypothetical protein
MFASQMRACERELPAQKVSQREPDLNFGLVAYAINRDADGAFVIAGGTHAKTPLFDFVNAWI